MAEGLRSLPGQHEDVDPNPSPALSSSPTLVTAAWLVGAGSTAGLVCHGGAWRNLWLVRPGLGTLGASAEIATSPGGATWQNLPISRKEFAHSGGLGREEATSTHVCWLQKEASC